MPPKPEPQPEKILTIRFFGREKAVKIAAWKYWEVVDELHSRGGRVMGLWYKPQEFFKKFYKKDLREVCREKYGEDFVKMYDMLNNGIPIGNIEETKIFLAMVEEVDEG